jgi:hypothetical protein
MAKQFNFRFWEKPKDEVQLQSHTFNMASPWNVNVKYDLSAPFINQYSGLEYLPFGVDNLYPYILLDVYHGSPFHAAIVEFKTRAVMADGLEFSVKGLTKLEGEILRGKLEERFDRKFFRRFVMEYILHERVYIEMTRKGDKGQAINIVPAEQVRISNNEHKKGFFVNPDWRRKRADSYYVPRFDKYNTNDKIQMMEFTEETPGFYGYAVPSYSTAANWLYLDSEIAFLQKQNLENSINPSAIFKFYQDIKNPEAKQKFISELQDSFTGARNAGKVLVFFANGKDLAPDVQMAEPNKLDNAFAGVQENIVKNVAYAHLVNPVLMGISTAGQLGNVQQMNDAFMLFNQVWLSPTQDTIEDYLNDILKCAGYDARVTIKRKSQFLPEREITPTINE